MIRTGLLGKAWGWAADGLPISASAAMATTNANRPAAGPPMPCAPCRILAKYSLKRAARGRQRKWRRTDNGAVADSRARAQWSRACELLFSEAVTAETLSCFPTRGSKNQRRNRLAQLGRSRTRRSSADMPGSGSPKKAAVRLCWSRNASRRSRSASANGLGAKLGETVT
jgi:hypothetical protein